MPQQVRRRLATVYFIDIVGSTALATKLDDARWRELLTRFRRVVRAELKRYGGREQDTAGDGFFATFGEPAQALRAAASIAGAVQDLGVDVRTGIHTGECEEIDGKLGGIAVHVAARVMSLAGPAEVLATSTVRDLVSGSGATFEDRGTHELKGVEETRQLYSLTAVETRLPEPLTPEEAASRLEHVVPGRISRRTRMVVIAVAALLVAAAVAAGLVAFLGGGGASAAEPIDLLRIDPSTRQIVDTVHGSPLGTGLNDNLWASDGTLWEMGGIDHGRLAARNIKTGAIESTIDLGDSACKCQIAFGFGSLWLAKSTTIVKGPHTGKTAWKVERIAPISGRKLHAHRSRGPAEISTIAAGNGAVWILQHDGTLLRIDPVTDTITGKWDTHAVETGILVPYRGYEWICECLYSRVRRFDADTGKARTFHIPEKAFLIGGFDGKVWFLDPENATVTPMDPQTGKTESPVGLGGEVQAGVIAFGSAWVAGGRVVERVDLANGHRDLIQMPPRVWAGGIAVDPTTRSLWVSNSRFRPRDS